MKELEGASVYIFETDEGWRVAMRLDSGEESFADTVVASKEEANSAFDRFCQERGIKQHQMH